MMRRLSAVALLALTAAFAGLGSWSTYSSTGVLSDRDLAHVFGGASDTGCVNDPNPPNTCNQVSFTCPQAPAQENFPPAQFTGCNTNGTEYWGTNLTTVITDGGTNTKSANFMNVFCQRPTGCVAGLPLNNHRKVANVCTPGHPGWQCRTCQTSSTAAWLMAKTWNCIDP